MSDLVPGPGDAPPAKPAVEISPFIAWMSRYGHWILFALFASEVLFEGWAIRSAKRREAALAAERAAVVRDSVVRDSVVRDSLAPRDSAR